MKRFDKNIPLFLDNHILVINKPTNMLTQPDKHGRESLQDLTKRWIQERFGKKNVFLHCVHRLDKVASGLVLFARSSKALSRLNKQLRENKVTRIYYAVVWGTFEHRKDTLEHFLIKKEHRAEITEHEGKEVSLSYEVLKQRDRQSLLKITLKTGRYHQIRAQMAAVGHPIVGDGKYGFTNSLQGIQLHHGELTFYHPVTQEKLTFKVLAEFCRTFSDGDICP